MTLILDDAYWSNRYKNNQTGWDIGAASTPLVEYINQLNNKNIAILIPGGGNAYEAAYLAEKGFTNITVIDIALFICEQLKKKLPSSVKIIHGDFFAHNDSYDLILEQTFFCALDPALRNNYAKKMYALLKKQSKLVGLLFNKEFELNPPFGGDCNSYRQLFKTLFRIAIMAPCYNSIKPRKETEVFIKLIKE